MSTGQMEQRVENVERRVDRIEQILPTLATREDLKAAIAPLATKAELREAIAESEQRMCARMDAMADGLVDRITETESRLRTHFDVVTESLRDDIRLVAEGVATLLERVDRTS